MTTQPNYRSPVAERCTLLTCTPGTYTHTLPLRELPRYTRWDAAKWREKARSGGKRRRDRPLTPGGGRHHGGFTGCTATERDSSASVARSVSGAARRLSSVYVVGSHCSRAIQGLYVRSLATTSHDALARKQAEEIGIFLSDTPRKQTGRVTRAKHKYVGCEMFGIFSGLC